MPVEVSKPPTVQRQPAPVPPAPPRHSVGFFVVIALLVVLLAAITTFFVVRALRPPAPLTQVPVSGRLEGYQSDLGAKVGGRVVWVAVREGALVRAGQVLVQLDDAQARAQAAASAAAVSAAEDRARQSQATLAVFASQIHEAALGGEQATADTSGRVAQARANAAAADSQVAQAAAVVQQAQANLAFARVDSARYDVFQLGEAAAAGDAPRALRILTGLRNEGVEPTLILWALVRELRGLYQAREARRLRSPLAPAGWNQVAKPTQAALDRSGAMPLARLIRHAGRADRIIKGLALGDAWSAVTALIGEVAGALQGMEDSGRVSA